MKKILFIIPLIAITLCGCNKVRELYPDHAYNYAEFDKNYYLEWNNVNKIEINEESKIVKNVVPEKISENDIEYKIHSGTSLQIDNFGVKNKLSAIDSSFADGYLSKLFDGRLVCGGYYQLSRVQINKTGFASYFPKELKEYDKFLISLRGGTTCQSPLGAKVNIDLHINFYLHVTNKNYCNLVTFNLSNFLLTTDMGGETDVIEFPIKGLVDNAVAYSITFELKDTRFVNLTDDMTIAGADHFSLMLYELLLPESKWY